MEFSNLRGNNGEVLHEHNHESIPNIGTVIKLKNGGKVSYISSMIPADMMFRVYNDDDDVDYSFQGNKLNENVTFISLDEYVRELALIEIKEALKSLDSGYENRYKFPRKLSPQYVDEILDELGATEGIGEDWNGCGLDWSMDLNIDGVKVHAWGSGYDGSLLFKKE